MTTLDALRIGDRGTVVRLDGVDALAARLLAMGVTEGEEVEVVAAAP
ncbi:MAG: FeoA domain-containing protein, partial [Planctomycetia bacterium]